MDLDPPNAASPLVSCGNATQDRLPLIILREAGDITLLIGSPPSPQPVLASRSVLYQASPMWKAMFGGRWAESDATEVSFSDDDIDSMLLVLRIAHLRFRELPGKGCLSAEGLVDLAFLCEKYDLVTSDRPFMERHDWIQRETHHFPAKLPP